MSPRPIRARTTFVLSTSLLALAVSGTAASAQSPAQLSADVRQYVTVDAPVVALVHARVIDGTGAPAKNDQTILISGGKITAVGNAGSVSVPANAKTIDLTGKSVLPGLVMVHEHMFYPSGPRPVYAEHAYSFPRMYLGGGATTIRTAGSIEPYTDLNLRKYIDRGQMPGPKMDVTGPYLNAPGFAIQFHQLADAADARRTVAQWADLGATSFKAYMNITRDELSAVVDEAHKRGLKVTGHICSVAFREAADIGIDNLEHGLVVASDFHPGKGHDECPPDAATSLAKLEVTSDTIQSLIRTLVSKKVAITSTLGVFETFVPQRPPLAARALEAMTTEARLQYLTNRSAIAGATQSPWTNLFKKEMQFEKAFVDAGGLLIAGSDPTGYGGVVPGYSNQRQIELLVEAGFTTLEAIKIATLNGATYLGRADRVGTVATGKDADLVVVAGDPSSRISDIQRVETVFKDGIGYDSAKLLLSGKGSVGAQ
jgi:imidazolonepropionase-like amidohydrolase